MGVIGNGLYGKRQMMQKYVNIKEYREMTQKETGDLTMDFLGHLSTKCSW